MQERMDVKERAHDFRFTYGDDGDDEQVWRVRACFCRGPTNLVARFCVRLFSAEFNALFGGPVHTSGHDDGACRVNFPPARRRERG